MKLYHSFPFVKQFDSRDCGPTCLKMITLFYKKNVSMQLIRDYCLLDRQGISIKGLELAADKLGIETLSLKTQIVSLKESGALQHTDLRELPLPLIAHWNNNHFIVVYKIKGDKIYIADPAQGKTVLDIDTFRHGFLKDTEYGKVVLLSATPAFYKGDEMYADTIMQESTQTVKKLFAHNKKRFVQIFLLLLFSVVIQSYSPLITQRIFDGGILQQNTGLIQNMLLIQVCVFLLSNRLQYFQSIIGNHLSQRINSFLIIKFVRKIFRLPIKLYNQKRSSDFIQRISDHSKIDSFITYSLSALLMSVISLFVFGILLLTYSVNISLIILVSAVLYIIWYFFTSKKRRELNYTRFDVQSGTHLTLIEMIEGISEIKLANSEDRKIDKWENYQKQSYDNKLKSLKLGQRQTLGFSLLSQLSYALITYYTALLVTQHRLTLGEMAAIQLIVAQVNSPIASLVASYTLLQDIKFSWERIMEVVSMQDEKSGTLPVPPLAAIEFDKLSFSFNDNSETIFKNFSLHIQEGKTTAIVGGSGSGKTTLMKLAIGLYAASAGKVLIGGRVLDEYDLKMWRKKCGVVMQEGYVFTDTIYNNITENDEEPDFDRYIEALKAAQIYDFVLELPAKHETIIGRSGAGLSTGQKQRMLLARLFYKRPDYIFLDEATNSLDANTESCILDYIDQHLANKTKIVIAHRLNTIIHAHNIVVLHNGRIEEMGTHKELMQKDGHYARLFESQVFPAYSE